MRTSSCQATGERFIAAAFFWLLRMAAYPSALLALLPDATVWHRSFCLWHKPLLRLFCLCAILMRCLCCRYAREQHSLKDQIRGKEEEVISMERLADELRRQEAQVSPASTCCDRMWEDMDAPLPGQAAAK